MFSHNGLRYIFIRNKQFRKGHPILNIVYNIQVNAKNKTIKLLNKKKKIKSRVIYKKIQIVCDLGNV